MRVLICDATGGGIIGCTTAYYLTRHPLYDPEIHKITVLEATRIAGGASGKAGGLLAVWAYPANMVPLSFKLHQDLSLEHGGEEQWGYRRVSCGNLEAVGRKRQDLERLGANMQKALANAPSATGRSLGKRGDRSNIEKKPAKAWSGTGMPKDLDWILPDLVSSYEKMGGSRETAQVHPYQFTTTLMRLAEEAGAKLIIGSVTDIDYADAGSSTPLQASPGPGRSGSKSPSSRSTSSTSSRGRKRVDAVNYIDKETGNACSINATHTIIAAGPWTARLFPAAPITGLRAHSVTITPHSPVSAYALFTELTLPGTRSPVSPEIYARPNNEIYVCGEGDMDVEVPETTAEVEVDEEKCDNLIAQVSSVSEHIRLGRVTRKQACYLPVLDIGGSGGPLVGETGIDGLLLATGHSCWGINNAPATGLLLSEMIMEGRAKSADIRSLDPRRIL